MDRQEEYELYKADVLECIDKLIVEYEEEYKDTPWYHNTENCHKTAKLNILKLLKKGIDEHIIIFEEGEEGCYLGACMDALDDLKHKLIFGDNEE